MIVNLKEQHCENFLQSLHKEQWQEVRLGEVAEIFDYQRIPLSTMQRMNRKGAYPYYGASGVIDYIDDFIFDGEFVLISEDGENLRTRKTPIAFKVSGKFWVNNHAHIVKGKKDYFNDLIVYLFENLDLNPYITGAVQPKLNQSTLLNIPLKIPILETTQQKIAEILSSFDDKIDLLHRQNKTLESLALTLFRHYFIDNPNRNEWEEVSLDDICLKIASGGTPSTTIKEYYCGNINWYSTKEFNDNFLFNSVQTITEKGLLNSSAKLFPKDTIVIAIYAAPTVGRLGILTQDSAFNQAACGLIVDETQCSKEFIFLFLKNERKNLNLLASGSAQQNLNVEKIKSYTLALPDKNSLHCFNIQAKGFFDKIYNNTKQIQNLQAMRDMLLKAIFE